MPGTDLPLGAHFSAPFFCQAGRHKLSSRRIGIGNAKTDRVFFYSGFLIRLAISPMMPRRKASTQMTKITPCTTVTQAPSCAR